MTQAAKQNVKLNVKDDAITAIIGKSKFVITPDNKVVAFTDKPVYFLKNTTEATSAANVSKDFAVAAYGSKIIPTDTGFFVQANSIESKTSTAINAALKAYKIGEHLKDGTVCVAVNLKNNTALFAPGTIFGGEATFHKQDDVVNIANAGNLNGHNDWRRINSHSEGDDLANNWNKIAPRKDSALPTFWTNESNGMWGGMVFRAKGNWGPESEERFYKVPLVRSGPALR